jgi:mycofactocin glycosyltransferase
MKGMPLPDRLKALWTAEGPDALSPENRWREQERLMDAHRQIWADAIRLAGHGDLKESLLSEIADFIHATDLKAIEQRCRGAAAAVKDEWHDRRTRASDREAVEAFYDRTTAYIYDLMWWHTLLDDVSPLAYVVAMQFAQHRGCHRCLDFGAGVGSASILFARHGFEVTLADISSNLLEFAAWRLRRRALAATLVDLKTSALPPDRYDLVTAMDVWEHLVDPVAAVNQLADAIAPGGFLFGRFAAEPDPRYPQHIVTDFAPTFEQLAKCGFVEVWRDDWLWGHRAFQKRNSTAR